MSTFKVNIVNLNDQEAGFKFLSKMKDDFQKSRALKKKRSKVIKRMKNELKEDMKKYKASSNLYTEVSGFDKKLRKPALKELKGSIKNGVMGVGAGFLSKAFSKISKSDLEELADKGDAEFWEAYNEAISNAISKKYPGNETFQQFAKASINNSIRKMYKGFREEALKDTDKYSDIKENTEPTPKQLENVFCQMQREKICFEIGLKYGLTICTKDNIAEEKAKIQKFKKDLKDLNNQIKNDFQPLNKLETSYEDLIDNLQNLGFGKDLDKDETDIAGILKEEKQKVLGKIYKAIFKKQFAPEDLTKQKLYDELAKKYFDKEKNRVGAFTPDSVNKSPMKAIGKTFKAARKRLFKFREGELDQEGGHFADDFESSIPDDVDVYGVTLSEVVNSSNSSRRSSRRSSRKKSSRKRR